VIAVIGAKRHSFFLTQSREADHAPSGKQQAQMDSAEGETP